MLHVPNVFELPGGFDRSKSNVDAGIRRIDQQVVIIWGEIAKSGDLLIANNGLRAQIERVGWVGCVDAITLRHGSRCLVGGELVDIDAALLVAGPVCLLAIAAAVPSISAFTADRQARRLAVAIDALVGEVDAATTRSGLSR